jgi:TM2 domain-containing membrane protein YozV
MKRKASLSSILSLLVPGLGQICSGKGERGAIILIAAILVGNLNAIWLSLYGLTSPETNAFWAHALPRILHDVFAAWSIVFYLWQTFDAYRQAK